MKDMSLSCSVCENSLGVVRVRNDYDLLKILGALCPSCETKGKKMPDIFDGDLK